VWHLEGDHDKDLVIRTLSFLTCAKGGLLETELLLLLAKILSNVKWEWRMIWPIIFKWTTPKTNFQRFVMGRAHVLVHSPSLTFSYLAYSLPNILFPSRQAHYRYYQGLAEQGRKFVEESALLEYYPPWYFLIPKEMSPFFHQRDL